MAAVTDPDRAPLAVEEMLRYFSIADIGTGRLALAETEIGSTWVAWRVIISCWPPIRDPAVRSRTQADLDPARPN